MRRFSGVSLLLILTVLTVCVLAGCGGSSISSNSRITVTGTIYRDDSGSVLTSSDLNGGTMKVYALSPGSQGLTDMADVDPATVVNGVFTLYHVPTDRRIVLKIVYTKVGVTTTEPFYTWYVFAASAKAPLAIYPRDWAASRLAFDLMRSYTDFSLDRYLFGNDYDYLLSNVESKIGSSNNLATWLAKIGSQDPDNFYQYLQGVNLNDASINASLAGILNRATGAEAGGDIKQSTLKSFSGAPGVEPDWNNSDYRVIDEIVHSDNYNVSNPEKILDAYLVGDASLTTQAAYSDDYLNILEIRAVERLNSDSTKDLLVRAESEGSSQTSAPTLKLVLRKPDLSLAKTYDLTYVKSHYYEVVVPAADLADLADADGYFLLQIVDKKAGDWPGADYSSIDLDRTPCAFVRLAN